ncbi:unnamed protein product [Dracunculus medinensis]|uniref:RING-type domain-containing protein n=1 Tax=Dracunculus medinensis TaxID=318479 RepID=A0A0N4UHW0_DRAME|nr:unnamed protein product [Dracunculus medinensis]
MGLLASRELMVMIGYNCDKNFRTFITYRLLIQSGWNEELGLTWDQLFPEPSKSASPEAIAKLERLISADLLHPEKCPICIIFCDNTMNVKLIRMPCNHLFHEDCVLPWLKLNNSCPMCRYELPSSDPLYEEYKKQKERRERRDADLDELHNSMFS